MSNTTVFKDLLVSVQENICGSSKTSSMLLFWIINFSVTNMMYKKMD